MNRSRRAVLRATQIIRAFGAHRCTMMAASIAFYSAFSLAPVLLVVLAISGWIFGPDAARGRLFTQIQGVLGNDAAIAIQAIVEHAHRSEASGMAAIVSVGALIVGASATFTTLNAALNVIFSAKPPRGAANLTLLLRTRLVSFGLVMGIGFLLVVSLALDTAISMAGHRFLTDTPLFAISEGIQFIVGLVILSASFTALLKWLPDASVPLGAACVGGIVSAVLFSMGRKIFALYLAYAGTADTFGAAGSLAVLMMWLYFSALVFLLGAECAGDVVMLMRSPPKISEDLNK